jgi:hypothetical protein
MREFPLAGRQTVADLPERVGSSQLAEKHRHKLSPGAKASGMPLGLGFPDQQLKLGARKELENLTEHATESIHVEPPFLGFVGMTLIEFPEL